MPFTADHIHAQPIAVWPGTHHETLAAVAIASAQSLIGAETTEDPWKTWLREDARKTVRKIKRQAQLGRITEDPGVKAETTVGAARAFCFEPMTYEAFPPHLRKLQVSGLDQRRQNDPDSWSTLTSNEISSVAVVPTVAISNTSIMSTGKAAAQVAHALTAWFMSVSSSLRTQWAARPELKIITGDLDTILPSKNSITIVDNGLTEIAPNTPTVRVAIS